MDSGKTLLQSATVKALLLAILGVAIDGLVKLMDAPEGFTWAGVKAHVLAEVVLVAGIYLRRGMGVPIVKALLLVMLIAPLAACGTTPAQIGPPAGTAGVSKGGDADSAAASFDTYANIVQPGATGVLSPVRNEDKLSNSQAGDSPQLVLGGASAELAKSFLANDLTGKALAEQQAYLFERLNDEDLTPEERLDVEAKIDSLVARLTEHETGRLERVQNMVGGNFSALTEIVFVVLQFKANGQEATKIQKDAIEAAAKSPENALKPAVNATE